MSVEGYPMPHGPMHEARAMIAYLRAGEATQADAERLMLALAARADDAERRALARLREGGEP